MTPCEVALAKAYGRIGSLVGQLSRARLRATHEAALRSQAQARVAQLEACLTDTLQQLEAGGVRE